MFDSYVKLAQEAKPDYMIVSVSRKGGAARGIVEELAQLGMPVLMETPPADTLEDLIDFYKKCATAKIQVAEQYQFQPMIAARIAVEFRTAGQCLPEPVSAAQWVSFYQRTS